MALWWITDVIPVYVTALLPLGTFPRLGTATAAEAASAYGDPLIFLFFGGFILALALERWGLHRRVAFTVLRSVGSRPDYIVGAFMGITAFISLWVTNTATTLMMLPVARGRRYAGGGAARRCARRAPHGERDDGAAAGRGLRRVHRRHGHDDRHGAECLCRVVHQ
jgi:sodium-dependent dicarboxylate transporter 2/3/5